MVHRSILSGPTYQVQPETQDTAQRRMFRPFYADMEKIFGVALKRLRGTADPEADFFH